MFKCMDVFGMWKEILPVYCDGLTNSFCVFGMCKRFYQYISMNWQLVFFVCFVCEIQVFDMAIGFFFIMFRWIVNFYLEIRI